MRLKRPRPLVKIPAMELKSSSSLLSVPSGEGLLFQPKLLFHRTGVCSKPFMHIISFNAHNRPRTGQSESNIFCSILVSDQISFPRKTARANRLPTCLKWYGLNEWDKALGAPPSIPTL